MTMTVVEVGLLLYFAIGAHFALFNLPSAYSDVRSAAKSVGAARGAQAVALVITTAIAILCWPPFLVSTLLDLPEVSKERGEGVASRSCTSPACAAFERVYFYRSEDVESVCSVCGGPALLLFRVRIQGYTHSEHVWAEAVGGRRYVLSTQPLDPRYLAGDTVLCSELPNNLGEIDVVELSLRPAPRDET